jgi:hypothetical protein
MKSCNHNAFVRYDFIFMLYEEGLQETNFFICSKVLSSGSRKASKLKEHCTVFALRMLETQKLYLKSGEKDLKQGAHSPIVKLFPQRSQRSSQVIARD